MLINSGHLGNIRLSYAEDPADPGKLQVIEENNYYAFGLKHDNYNVDKRDYVDGGSGTELDDVSSLKYKYKFNGQEWQDELGLNITAMDWRQYDNAIGRFVGIDALAETQFSYSPYHFGYDNPMYFADPSGLKGRSNLLVNDFEGGLHVVTPDQYTTEYKVGPDAIYQDGNMDAIQLPEIQLGGGSGGWASQIEQHVYGNSPFYNNSNFVSIGQNDAGTGVETSRAILAYIDTHLTIEGSASLKAGTYIDAGLKHMARISIGTYEEKGISWSRQSGLQAFKSKKAVLGVGLDEGAQYTYDIENDQHSFSIGWGPFAIESTGKKVFMGILLNLSGGIGIGGEAGTKFGFTW